MEIGIRGQKIQYEKREDGICITGCGGEASVIEIPETIEGIKVTSVGAYAFAQMQEVREIHLPDGVREIGRYAFYRCRNLEKLGLSDGILEIGGGALNGCRPGQVEIHLRRGKASALKSIVEEVRFAIRATLHYHREDGRVETAQVLFPEHYEEAVENTPARILYTSHHGSGGYYRQCFYERKLDFAKYDARLPWAVADETPETVAELALKRLRFPVGLSDRARESYEGFLRDEGAAAARFLIGEEDTEGIKFLLKRELLDSPAIETGIQAALDSGKTALVSLLMEERGRRFPRKQKTFEL